MILGLRGLHPVATLLAVAGEARTVFSSLTRHSPAIFFHAHLGERVDEGGQFIHIFHYSLNFNPDHVGLEKV